MKLHNVHLQYQPKDDRVLLVHHAAEPKTAIDCHEEFLYCIGVWGLRGASKPRQKNVIERFFGLFGWRVVQASEVREVVTKKGTLRVTVEHLV